MKKKVLLCLLVTFLLAECSEKGNLLTCSQFDENPIIISESNVEEVKAYFEDEGLTCKTNK